MHHISLFNSICLGLFWVGLFYAPIVQAAIERKTLIFSPKHKTWTAYNSTGEVIASGRASGGRSWCPDIRRSCRTITGTFAVYSKGGPGCISSKYPVGRGGAKMPYCMYFHKGFAIHGSNDVPNYNASHGCVRVTPKDAKWLSQNFLSIGTRVIVKPY